MIEPEIIKIPLHLMPNEMHMQCHDDIEKRLDKCIDEILAALDLGEIKPIYSANIATERQTLDIIKKSRYTRELHDADHQRDRAYTGFYAYVRTMEYEPDAETCEAAQRVGDVLAHYGSVARRGYDEESAAIKDIIRELNKPLLAADVKKIGAEVRLERLATLNDEFIELAHTRYEETAALPPARMRTARKETDRAYNHLAQRLEHLVFIGRISPILIELVTDLNVILGHYKNLMAQKAGRKKAAGKTGNKPGDGNDGKPGNGNETGNTDKPDTGDGGNGETDGSGNNETEGKTSNE